MKKEKLVKQSNTAYNQWAKQWREHAEKHSKFEQLDINELKNSGIGKAMLLVANGYSLEENIETIKKHKNNVDIMCCDKSLGHLLDHGIEPTYCVVCDANVDYEKYMEKHKSKLANTILLINVCANPKWSFMGNWKKTYFFVNKDVIESHLEFAKISGCKNFIPAGTNVSNAMVILATQCDNNLRQNFFGYDKYLLIGFDYSWKFGGKYYAFDETGGGKDRYMSHVYFNTPSGAFCYSSGNLVFSKDWIVEYIKTFDLPVVQCAKDSLLQLKHMGELEYQMQYSYKPEDVIKLKKDLIEFEEIKHKYNTLKNKMKDIGKDHHTSFLRSV